jgi:hypothetical protein
MKNQANLSAENSVKHYEGSGLPLQKTDKNENSWLHILIDPAESKIPPGFFSKCLEN